MYDYGTNYLVIDYIEGNTLFNCLLNGIPISEFHNKKLIMLSNWRRLEG